MSQREGFTEPGGGDKGRVRLAYLDGLRALAAGYVVMFHAVPGFSANQLEGPWRVLRRAFAFGHEAVAVFIVLSGYCLMLPVTKRDLQLDFGRFVRRRAFRILPPYFAALAGSIALLAAVPALRVRTGTIWDDSLPGLDAGAIATHLALVHNWVPAYAVQINGPLWSVASEWQIYFCFPLLLLPVWRRLGMPGALLVAAAGGYAPLLFAPGPSQTAIPWYLLLFAMGMAAAAINFSPETLSTRLRRSVNWRLVCAVVWLGCAGFSSLAAGVWFSLKPVTDALVGFGTAALLVHVTSCAVAGRPSRLLGLLETRPLVGLGHFSYSLYLTHLPVLAGCYLGLRRLDLSPPALTLALLLLGSLASLAVAYAFFVAVERRFLLER